MQMPEPIIARITKVSKHPRADRLKVCQADIGSGGGFLQVQNASCIEVLQSLACYQCSSEIADRGVLTNVLCCGLQIVTNATVAKNQMVIVAVRSCPAMSNACSLISRAAAKTCMCSQHTCMHKFCLHVVVEPDHMPLRCPGCDLCSQRAAPLPAAQYGWRPLRCVAWTAAG